MKHNWIPVFSEPGCDISTLPELTHDDLGLRCSDRVLVCTDKGEIFVATLCEEGEEQYWWANGPDKSGSFISQEDVVAWMSLPEQYSMKGN